MNKDKQSSLMKVLSHLRLSDTVNSKDGLMPEESAASPSSNTGSGPFIQQSTDNPRAEINLQDENVGGDGHGTCFINDDGTLPTMVPAVAPAPGMDLSLDNNEIDAPHHSSPEDHMQIPNYSPYPGWGSSNLSIPGLNMPLPDVNGFEGFGHTHLDHDSLNQQQTLQQPKVTPSDSESTEVLVNQLSDRIGSLHIGPGGQVRYYGPTSNFNLVDMGAPDNLTVHRSVRTHGPEYLNHLNMGKEVPEELENHLINLYFAWQDPALHVVKREMYKEAKVLWRDQEKDTPYFSESLHNAM